MATARCATTKLTHTSRRQTRVSKIPTLASSSPLAPRRRTCGSRSSLSRTSTRTRGLDLPAGGPAHYWIQDDRDIRYADVTTSGDAPVSVVLVAPGEEASRFYIHSDQMETVIDIAPDATGTPPVYLAENLDWDVSELDTRSAIEEEFRLHLFATPVRPFVLRGIPGRIAKWARPKHRSHGDAHPGQAAHPVGSRSAGWIGDATVGSLRARDGGRPCHPSRAPSGSLFPGGR